MNKSNADELTETVDEIADDANPPRVEREAERFGLSIDELMRRVTNEIKARL